MKSEFTTKPLSALADIQTGPFGSQLHKEDYVQNGTPIVTVEHLGQKRFTEQNLPCVSEIDKERLSKYILREGDVVFSRVGSVDRCSHVFKLDFGDKGFNEFAYFFMQTDYAYHWLASNGGKAAVPGINQQNVKDIWIFSPENSKVKEFGEWVQPLFTTILKNCAQNVKLAELRDTLLPKLMSGELDVSDIEL